MSHRRRSDALVLVRPASVRNWRVTSVGFALLIALVGCSDGDGSSPAAAATVLAAELPTVEQIDDAIAALEAELGGVQEYFEINATARLVNLFVALDGATSVQAWLFLDGELTSEDVAPAEGGVLRAVDLDFDPVAIFSVLLAELPGATIESFYIHGDGQGAVQYGALLTTSLGGAIDVQLSSDGQVLSSEPLN